MASLSEPGGLDTDEIKPSDVFKKVKLTMWVLKDKYYLRKATLLVSADNSAYVSQYGGQDSIVGPLPLPLEESMDFALSVSLTKVGEEFRVSAPEDSMTTEEFVAEAMQIFMEMQTLESEALYGEEFGDLEDIPELDSELFTESKYFTLASGTSVRAI